MVREILENIAPIEALDKKYGVVSLFLFGSAARHATLTEVRDLDFLVQFQAMPPVEYAHSYFGFAEDLEALFNTRVDLVETRMIENPYLLESIEATKVLLFGPAPTSL